MIRRILVILSITILTFLLVPSSGGGRKARAQDEGATISSYMNAYYYQPGEQAYLDVDMELPEESGDSSVRLDLLIYSSATTRSYLSSFREEPNRYPIYRRRLEIISPEEEWTDKLYEIDLGELGFSQGVYPFEVRATQVGKTLANDYNYLVIMAPEAGYPLNLSLLWTLDFLPLTDAQGNELDTGLYAACSSSSSETGFLYALTEAMRRSPEVLSNMVLPYTTYEDLEELAAEIGEGVSEQPAEAEENAENVEKESTDIGPVKVLENLDQMFESGQVDLIATSYAFANLDLLTAMGWEMDTERQMQFGLEGAEELDSEGKGFINPLFHLSDGMLQRLVDEDIEFTVVDEETVGSCAAGRGLLEGTTLSQPVNFINQNGLLLKAFVRDEALCSYLNNTTQRDAHHMVQNIYAELAVLQREQPYSIRSCVLAFPNSFAPNQDFLEDLYTSLDGCPWLQTRRLSELNTDQFPLKGIALQAPLYQETQYSYNQKLEPVRKESAALSSAIPDDQPLREHLARCVLRAENYRFEEEKNVAASQRYIDSINGLIENETGQVIIEKKSTVTLSSTEGQLTVDITSALDYPMKGLTLRLENSSISFPEGRSQEVTIEPQENHFIFSVDTHRKGSFIIDIVLETGDLVVDSTTTTINTSIINTLAIILLACLAFLMAITVIIRRLIQRFRSGKHSKGRKE
ncbi:MAG: DUF6049 family protein [Actinomycetota bacterium]|nr:DUF6049 family protein [Actinomycetota bacterium]